MRKEVGMWIDHRRAAIVSIVDGQERLEVIESNMEKHIGPAGGARSSTPFGLPGVVKEDGRERKFKLHLSRWYDQVEAQVGDADALLLFGPGEAKHEFQRHIAKSPLAGRVVGIETCDKLTDHQIAAKVRKHFAPAK